MTERIRERTPLYGTASGEGAVFGQYFGWDMPSEYGDISAEYDSSCRCAALFDISHHGKTEVREADAAAFLHNLCTNEVKNLPAGSGCEAFLTTAQAKIAAFVVIYRGAQQDRGAFSLDTGPGWGEKVFNHLNRYLISEQVELSDRTHDLAQMHLAGPQAREMLARALENKLPELLELQHVTERIAGVDCQLRRREPLGLLGYDLLCEKDRAASVWRALVAAGARPAGLKAYDTLRIEAGTPIYGPDIDDTNLPQEIGRVDRTISFTKGCYIGQETVARIRTYGHVNRSLVGLKLAEPGSVPAGGKLFQADKEAGRITSSALSPRLGQIALAYVRKGSHEPGTMLELETADGRRSAQVTCLPFTGAA
jgi:glycine cleavage system T protein